jgi:hypothetical protein
MSSPGTLVPSIGYSRLLKRASDPRAGPCGPVWTVNLMRKDQNPDPDAQIKQILYYVTQFSEISVMHRPEACPRRYYVHAGDEYTPQGSYFLHDNQLGGQCHIARQHQIKRAQAGCLRNSPMLYEAHGREALHCRTRSI